MVRPCKRRMVRFAPRVIYYKPQGVPLAELEEEIVTTTELEALRLKNIEKLDQIASAKKTGISQSTFKRILSSAYKKISAALINGKAIRIERADV